jgi:hypothetical protein
MYEYESLSPHDDEVYNPGEVPYSTIEGTLAPSVIHDTRIWFSPDYLVCLLPIILTEATYFYPP